MFSGAEETENHANKRHKQDEHVLFKDKSILNWIFYSLSTPFTVFHALEASEYIVLQLAWKHQCQFAGYYATLHRGFYAKEGLDVEIVEGGEGEFTREEVKSGHTQ